MIFQRTAEELNSWKNQMKDYEKGKRTKKPFGKSLPHVNHISTQDIKHKQNNFNPLLQKFNNNEDEQKADSIQQNNRVRSLINHIKNVQKYQKNYDIVNLHGYQTQSAAQKVFAKKLGPIRNAYNVINNQKLPDFYFTNRDLQIPQERHKQLLDKNIKEFDIITGNYKENNQQRLARQYQSQNEELMNRYSKTHNYDPVFGRFYNAVKEQQYMQELKEKEKEHGKDIDKKYPPSYIQRQPLIMNFDKPLSQALVALDQKQQKKKKKYQLKYLIQDQYQHRNQQEEERQDKAIRNKVHDGRLLDQKAKQFDIITNSKYPDNRVENLFGKKPKLNSWEDYIKPTDKQSVKTIKSSGFN